MNGLSSLIPHFVERIIIKQETCSFRFFLNGHIIIKQETCSFHIFFLFIYCLVQILGRYFIPAWFYLFSGFIYLVVLQ